MDFEIASVKTFNEGQSEKEFTKVAFAFKPSGMYPTKITRSYKSDKKESGYGEAVEMEFEGATLIRVKSSFLRRSKNGDLFIQVPAGLDLNWDLSRAIAEAAADRLGKLPVHLQPGKSKGAA